MAATTGSTGLGSSATGGVTSLGEASSPVGGGCPTSLGLIEPVSTGSLPIEGATAASVAEICVAGAPCSPRWLENQPTAPATTITRRRAPPSDTSGDIPYRCRTGFGVRRLVASADFGSIASADFDSLVCADFRACAVLDRLALDDFCSPPPAAFYNFSFSFFFF